MKPYSDYSAEELAMESLFIRWVRSPDDPSICNFWENWMIKYPSKKDTVEQARQLVLTASDWRPDGLSIQEVNSVWGRIMSSLEIRGDREPIDSSVKWFKNIKIIRGVIVLLMSVTFLFFLLYFFFIIF